MSTTARQHSFSLHCRTASDVGPVQVDVMLQSLSSEIAERGLALLRNSAEDLSFVVIPASRDITEDDRRALARWAVARQELADYRVGPLSDRSW